MRHGCDGWCVRGIERWLADAIITAEQATQMRADLPEPAPPAGAHGGPPAPTPRTSRAALVTEALGYLGGVIILVGLGFIVGSLWNDLSVGVRLGLVGVETLLLLVAGALIPARLGATGAVPDAGALLGLAVWGVSAARFALAWGGVIPGRQVGTVLGAIGMVVGAATLVVAAVLTTRRRGDAAPGEEARWAVGTRWSASLVAVAIVVATSAVVLVAGAS